MFTVTNAADDLSLLTAAEARAAINGASATDNEIAALIARVSASITKACNVPADGDVPPTLRLEEVSDTFRLKSQQDALILSRRPIVSVTSIVESDATLDASEYEIRAAAGLLKRLSGDAESCWPCGKIVVAYSAGWATVPDDLKEAAARVAKVFWSEGKLTDPNQRRLAIPGVIDVERWVGPADDPLMSVEIMQLLRPYRQVVVG